MRNENNVLTFNGSSSKKDKERCDRAAFLRRRLFMIGDRHRKMLEEESR